MPDKNKLEELERERQIKLLLIKKAEIQEELKRKESQARCFYFKPYGYQQEVLDHIKSNNIVIMPSPNKLGKTGLGANIVISWCLGFEPWNPVEKDYPDAVKFEGQYYKPSSLGIAPPVKIRITGEDWLFHIGQTIVPELKKWAPAVLYETKKNNVGVEYFWTWKNGSTIEIMTHDQDDALFEGWLGHGWWPDEPPPKSKYTGMSRGLFLTGGKVFMSMTPLKEAWVLDDLMLSGRQDVWYIPNLSIWDNPDMYNKDCNVLRMYGLDDDEIKEYFAIQRKCCEKEKPLDDAETYLKTLTGDNFGEVITKLSIHRFIKDIPMDERPPRLFGTFKSLVGLVLKKFDPNVHIIEPIKVPTDWPVTCMIDWHLNKPQAVLFFAVDPRGIHYIVDEIWENMDAEETADETIRRKRKNLWRLEQAEIDPLARGDNAYVKNRLGAVQDSYKIISDKLAQAGIILSVASKDKESGVLNLQNWLAGQSKVPTLYVCENCKQTIFQIQRWVYDDDGKPKKENDDFPENMYRYTLKNVKYTSPQEFSAPIKYANLGVA